MKNFILLVALFLVAPFAQGSSPQHLLVGGSGWNKIAIINKDTKEIVWDILWKKAGNVTRWQPRKREKFFFPTPKEQK